MEAYIDDRNIFSRWDFNIVLQEIDHSIEQANNFHAKNLRLKY